MIPMFLNGIRKERMRAYGLPENTSYSDIEKNSARTGFLLMIFIKKIRLYRY